jgi:hypothetical protein
MIPNTQLMELAQKEIQSDYTFVQKIKSFYIAVNENDSYTQYMLSKAISEDISSLQNKHHIDFLEYKLVLNTKNVKLQDSYSKNEIKEMDEVLGKGKKFEKYLKRIGYEWGEARMRYNEDFLKYLPYV